MVENKFVGKGRIEILTRTKRSKARGGFSLGGIRTGRSVKGCWTGSWQTKETSFKLAMPTPIKARDPFVRIRKKIVSN